MAPKKKTHLIIFTSILFALLACGVIFFYKNITLSAKQAMLPHDVDMVVQDYTFSHSQDGLSIFIKGKTAITRGRGVFGLRSMVAKQTFIEDISGSIQSHSRTIAFSALKGAWAMNLRSPLELAEIKFLQISGKHYHNVKQAKIDFGRLTVLAIFTDGSERYL